MPRGIPNKKPSGENPQAALSPDEVRIYEVLTTALPLQTGATFSNESDLRRKGERVASVEFQPANLEQRFLTTQPPSMHLVEKLTLAEWDAEQERESELVEA